MTEKRFELNVNQHNQCDIVDLVESKEKNAICIYNDLGNYHFSSAKALCELLNELNDKCEFLEIENESLEDGATYYAELYHKSLKENEQLKQQLFCNCDSVCDICKHHQLIEHSIMQGYYIGRCEKGHEECGRETLRHCEDFKVTESKK